MTGSTVVGTEDSALSGRVELSMAISAIRDQLIEAQRKGVASGAGQQLSFNVDRVVVEFTGEVSVTGGVEAGAKFWVLTAAGKAERGSVATQKVTVELTPTASDGSSYKVGDGVSAPPSR